MTAITFNAARRRTTVASKLRSVFGRIVDGLDAFATYRMQRAIPEAEFRRIRREINRYHRIMQPDNSGRNVRR